MRQELTTNNANPLFKPKLRKLAEAAERAHLRAFKYAARSVENMARSGRALRKFRDLADDKDWEDLILHKFEGSERTVQRYMYLAKYWSLLEANAPPEGLTSQRKAIQLIRRLLRSERATDELPATRGKRRPVAVIDVAPEAADCGTNAAAPPSPEAASATSSAADDHRRTSVARMYEDVLHILAELTEELSQLRPPHSVVAYALGSIANAKQQVEQSAQRLNGGVPTTCNESEREMGDAVPFLSNDDEADADAGWQVV